jgi:Concanavalin A-like lectin/glucanases superfamily
VRGVRRHREHRQVCSLPHDLRKAFQTIASDKIAVHGPVTMEMWVRIVEPGEGVIEIRLHNFAFWLRGQRVTFLVQSAHVVESPDLGVGDWRHIAGTFDGARLRLYLDGVEVANARGSLAGNSRDVLASLQIVHHPTGPDHADALWIDDTPSARTAHSSRGY